MNTITKADFLSMVRLHHLEVLTDRQFTQNTHVLQSYLQKALTVELSAQEQADANVMVADIGSLEQWMVLRDDFTKAICYTRPEQVEWDEAECGEFGEIVKAKGGVYKNTTENRKKGVVGQKYGAGAKEEEERGEKQMHLSPEKTKEMQDATKKWKEDTEKRHKGDFTPITSEFGVRDALGGDMSGDYKKDLARVEKQSKKTFSEDLYNEAYQNQEQP